MVYEDSGKSPVDLIIFALSRKTSLKFQWGQGVGGEVGVGMGDWVGEQVQGGRGKNSEKILKKNLKFYVSFREISRKFPMMQKHEK